MKSCHLVYAFCLFFFHAGNAQDKKYLDSLNLLSKTYVCMDNEKFDSLSLAIIEMAEEQKLPDPLGDALIIKGYSNMCSGDLEQSLSTLQEALDIYRMTKNLKGLATAYHHMGSAALRLSRIDSAFQFAKMELEYAKKSEDTLILASYYLTMSGIHTMVAQSDSTIFYAIGGLESLGNVENDKLRGSLNIAIGNSYYLNEDYPQAIKYFSRAQQYFSEESMNMGRIYHNLASCFTPIKQYDSSIYYFNKTIEINQRLERKLFLAYNYQSLAHTYNQLEDCAKSIEYNLLSLKMSIELGEIRSRAAVHANISECYVLTGELDKAVANALEALRLTKENGDVDKEADAYFLLSEAYRARGEYKLAFDAHKSFYSLDSMLLGRDRLATIAGLEADHETERREAEIASLSQQASIQGLEIRQKNQAIIIGVVVVLFIFSALFFFSKQRAAKKERKQTELEQRFLRSQLNPHFISNALVAVQSFMLNNDSEAAALYLTKFSKLMREILENSRKEFIPVEEEIGMLKNYLDIHKLRFKESFEYNIIVDENINPEEDTIPPMFVQPFVENSIEHGIINANGKGVIDLNFVKQDGYISIEVKDNGGGLVSSPEVESHTSLSSTIIRERMELFNQSLKNKIQLVLGEIKNDNGEIAGTKVELKVPFSYV